MRLVVAFLSLLLIATTLVAQSGRKSKVVKVPEPAPQPSPTPPPVTAELPQVTAEKRELYRCTDDGTLARILISEDQHAFLPKQVDTRANILERPAPDYTPEARRRSVRGRVQLSVILSADGTIGPIGIVRGLPAGLTESAMSAACKIKFKPAMKDGEAVSLKVIVEYDFFISRPSIVFP